MEVEDYKTIVQGSMECGGTRGHLEKEMSVAYALIDLGQERKGGDFETRKDRYKIMVACPEKDRAGNCKNSGLRVPYGCHVQRELEELRSDL